MGVRNCFVRVNSDAAYRARFIRDPVAVLKSEGVTLSAKDQRELRAVMKSFSRSLPSLGALPTGYEALISAIGDEARLRKDPFIMMLL